MAKQFFLFYLMVIDPTPERDKSPDSWKDSLNPVPDMDYKGLRLSLNSPVPGPLYNSNAPVQVGPKNLQASNCPQCSRELFAPLYFRTQRSPKTGTRRCSNRYTKYLVRLF